MRNILKRLEAWVISWRQNEFERAAIKLALWHSLGIFLVLVISSILIIVLYSAGDVAVHVEDNIPETEHTALSLYELQEHLIEVIILVDLVMFFVGLGISYLDARRILRPLKSMYQRQEQFMGDVAHELRTPLTVMKIGTESLLRQDRPTAEYVDYLRDAHGEIDRMVDLVNNLLYLVRHKKVETTSFKEVDLAAIIDFQVKNFLPYAAEKGIEFNFVNPGPKIVTGSANDLHRLVQNLIKNAIDYNIQDGHIKIDLTQEGKRVLLTISDTGIGIAANQLEKVFDRFYRVDEARSGETGAGSGLGLAIVKAIIDKHQGSISITSTQDKGTKVAIVLPLK